MARDEYIDDTQNVVGRMERLPITRYVLLVVSIAAVGNFFDIFNLDSLGAVLPLLKTEFALSGFLASQLVASLFYGMFVGSIIIGFLVDRAGRRPLFNATLIILAVGVLITGLAQNYTELWLGRFISGIGVGGDFAAIWAYFNELVPGESRGRYYAIALGLGIISIPVVTFYAAYLVNTFPVNGWRYLFLTSVIVALMVLPMRLVAPESPRFYLFKGDSAKADEQMKKIEKSVEKQYRKPLPETTAKPAKLIKYSTSSAFKLLFRKGQAYKTVMLTFIWIFQTWAFYGFTAFLVLILYEEGFGIVHAIIFSGIGFIGGTLGPFLMAAIGDKRLQRRHALIIFSLATAVLDIAFGFSRTVILIVVLAFFINMFQQAFATNIHSYTPETFPAAARGLGGGFVDGIGRLLFAVGAAVIASSLAGKATYQFLFIGISWLLVAIFAYAIKTNTNMRTLEDVTEGVIVG